jgi:hypothetical protein
MKLPNFFICGIEHSGTTLLSDIFRQIPECESGFEVGALICDSPKDFLHFKPYCDHMIQGWKITQEEFASICDTDSFSIFYDRLFSYSRIINDSHCLFFDKTPRYILFLKSCYSKFKKPFVCIYKDPRSVVYSNWKRRDRFKIKFDNFIDFVNFFDLSYMKRCYSNIDLLKKRPHMGETIRLEELSESSLNSLFDKLNIKFDPIYTKMKNKRYEHNKSETIENKFIFEYKEALSKNEIDKLTDKTADLEKWFI